MDVPVASRRSRGRGSRYAGAAPPRQARGTPAHAQAAQETGLRAEITDDRQAGLLRLRFSALRLSCRHEQGGVGTTTRSHASIGYRAPAPEVFVPALAASAR